MQHYSAPCVVSASAPVGSGPALGFPEHPLKRPGIPILHLEQASDLFFKKGARARAAFAACAPIQQHGPSRVPGCAEKIGILCTEMKYYAAFRAYMLCSPYNADAVMFPQDIREHLGKERGSDTRESSRDYCSRRKSGCGFQPYFPEDICWFAEMQGWRGGEYNRTIGTHHRTVKRGRSYIKTGKKISAHHRSLLQGNVAPDAGQA